MGEFASKFAKIQKTYKNQLNCDENNNKRPNTDNCENGIG
jgi:hypothetical protein